MIGSSDAPMPESQCASYHVPIANSKQYMNATPTTHGRIGTREAQQVHVRPVQSDGQHGRRLCH